MSSLRPQRIYSFGEDRRTKMCIYTITHNVTGKQYVGQSVGVVSNRWRAHINKSGAGVSVIKEAIRKYGFQNFTFKVVDTAQTTELLDLLETEWISKLNTVAPNGYNLRNGGGSKGKMSEEAKQKMSESRLAYLDRTFGEDRELKHPRKAQSQEERDERTRQRLLKMAASKRGVPTARKGTKLPPEWVKNMSLCRIGVPNPKKWKPIVRDDGVEYPSLQKAVEEIGCHRGTLTKHLKGLLKTIYGRTYTYKK